MKNLLYLSVLYFSLLGAVELQYPENAEANMTWENDLDYTIGEDQGSLHVKTEQQLKLKKTRNQKILQIVLKDSTFNLEDERGCIESAAEAAEAAYRDVLNRPIEFFVSRSSVKLDPKTGRNVKRYYRNDDLDSSDLVPLFVLAGQDLQEGQIYYFYQTDDAGTYTFSEQKEPGPTGESIWEYHILSVNEENVTVSYHGDTPESTVDGQFTINPENALDFELDQTASDKGNAYAQITETIKIRPTP